MERRSRKAIYRSALAAAIVVGLAVPAISSAAGPGNPTTDVTAINVVQRDLGLAATYWRAVNPSLNAPCTRERVLVTPMTDAMGNDGTNVPASDIWAETALDQCTIDISGSMWQALQATDPTTEYAVCTTFAHELAHTLGMPDASQSPGGMLNASPNARHDPLCSRMAYGHVSPAAHEWLVEHGLAGTLHYAHS
jgi:hypothetical protein